MTFLFTACLLLTYVAHISGLPVVHPDVHRRLETQDSVDLMLDMVESEEDLIDSVGSTIVTSLDNIARALEIDELVQHLKGRVLEKQAPILDLIKSLDERQIPSCKGTKTSWIGGRVYIQGAAKEMLSELQAIPSIAHISTEPVFPILSTENGNLRHLKSYSAQWGVQRIEAPEVWAKGITGKGVVVASLDTGVRGTHEVLRANWRSDHGWFDPKEHKSSPYDDNGHGTHTIATAVGSSGYGVAPEAQWIACKGCRSDGCYASDLDACAEFVMCPSNPDGSDPDCSKAPDIVLNSWGVGPNDPFFQKNVDAWRRAGIVPVVAIGNSGPECNTALSPGDYANTIGVGATNYDEKLHSTSSRGSPSRGYQKPDVSAPGSNIVSASAEGDSDYASKSGTSMAAPHVAGTVALMLEKNPKLTFDQITHGLALHTNRFVDRDIKEVCGSTSSKDFPNNFFGYGRVNAKQSIEAV